MKPKILWLWKQESAVSYYRAKLPARKLQEKGYDITIHSEPYSRLKPSFTEWAKNNLGKWDLLLLDRTSTFADLPTFAGLRHYSPGMRMVTDFDDDFLNVPWWNQATSLYKPGCEARESGLAHLKLSELVTASTESITQKFRSRTHDIIHCPNGLDPEDWTKFPTNPDRHKDPNLRVLYGGASGHFGDMDEARLGVETVIENPPVPFRFICFGAIPGWLHELSRKYPQRVVRLPWVSFASYPQAIAWGGFDVAIAPLAEHTFNDSKSDIKWQEAAVQGIPFLCSDVGPFKSLPKGTAVKVSNTPVQWAEGLRNLLTDVSLREKLRLKAKEAVLDIGTIDKTVSKWEVCIERAMSRPRIETLEDIRLPDEEIK